MRWPTANTDLSVAVLLKQVGRHGCALFLILIMIQGSFGAAHADSTVEREAQLTAAYIFNFMKFVEWPATVPADALQVCFAGAPNVHDALANAAVDKRIGTRRIEVRSLASEASGHCQVIYFSKQTQVEPQGLPSPATLTIGEEAKFLQQGGSIQLYAESNRLRFAINVDNCRRAGLTISSNLLKLATRVEQGARQ